MLLRNSIIICPREVWTYTFSTELKAVQYVGPPPPIGGRDQAWGFAMYPRHLAWPAAKLGSTRKGDIKKNEDIYERPPGSYFCTSKANL